MNYNTYESKVDRLLRLFHDIDDMSEPELDQLETRILGRRLILERPRTVVVSFPRPVTKVPPKPF